jgi:uroporphyrinogen decarboxylase
MTTKEAQQGPSTTTPALPRLFAGEVPDRPPIWLMRQAGRYLAEYRAIRADAGTFLDLCYAPELACEVTLQPIRRFGFDAAIIFSDILVVPHALGQEVRFEEGEGPRLEPITDREGLKRLTASRTGERFGQVYAALRLTRAGLPASTSLIGFCGAPWTVATYMVAGRGSTDQAAARSWAYRDPDGFQLLIDTLVATSIDYLSGQVAAGADTLQIFDSWAGTLAEDEFHRWVIAPTRSIVAAVKARHPGVPIIGFPRGGAALAADYIMATNVDGIGCDTAMPASMMRALKDRHGVVVQGNLDPLRLVAGGPAMDRRIDDILQVVGPGKHIFNLGHGIVPETPIDHVAQLVERVRSAKT